MLQEVGISTEAQENLNNQIFEDKIRFVVAGCQPNVLEEESVDQQFVSGRISSQGMLRC